MASATGSSQCTYGVRGRWGVAAQPRRGWGVFAPGRSRGVSPLEFPVHQRRSSRLPPRSSSSFRISCLEFWVSRKTRASIAAVWRKLGSTSAATAPPTLPTGISAEPWMPPAFLLGPQQTRPQRPQPTRFLRRRLGGSSFGSAVAILSRSRRNARTPIPRRTVPGVAFFISAFQLFRVSAFTTCAFPNA